MDLYMVFWCGVLMLFAAGHIVCGLCVFVYGAMLHSYLKKNKYARWCELTTVGRFGPGGSNSIRDFRYIYSDRDNDDERVVRFKDSLRKWTRAFLFCISVEAVAGCILMTSACVFGKMGGQ